MDVEKVKMIVKNMELLVTALKSEIYNDSGSYKQVKQNQDHISDYDEIFEDYDYPN